VVDRRRLLLGGATFTTSLATSCATTHGLGLLGSPAFADRALDVQLLQTSAAIENLAVELYTAALEVPAVGGDQAEPLVRDFFARTRDQHTAHAKAFNAALSKLGARTQANPDPALRELVAQARTRSPDASKAVEAGIAVETSAAATFQSNVAALSDADARGVSAAIGGVEAQHLAVLLFFAAVLREGAPELLRLNPKTVDDLSPHAAAAGAPDPFTSTERARPPGEGAVR
jgi:rubrerythrin